MECPNCDTVGTLDDGTFQSNLGAVNLTLTYLCTKCGEQFDIGSCDRCGEYVNLDTLTDCEPFLCRQCADRR